MTIDEILTRGVENIYPSREELKKLLVSGRRIRLYQGFDPTGIQFHIGHMVGLRKLKQFQELGHEVIFLIGDGTGEAGDPSGKTRPRKEFLSHQELLKNARGYIKQAGKILNFKGPNPVKVWYNSKWLNKLTKSQILEIVGHFTLQQIIERDLYQERLKNNIPLNMREFMYPFLQGYDSVAMKVDLEIGGSDQLFNMLTGRTLVKAMLGRDKFVLTTPLLIDSTGRKIGKTEGNVIAIAGEPEQLFAQIMSLSDDVIAKGLEYLTDVPVTKIKNPLESKKLLAYEVVKQLNDKTKADQARDSFEKKFQKRDFEGELRIIKISKSKMLRDVLVENKIVSSNSEFARLVKAGAVEVIGGEKVTDPFLKVQKETPLRVGKRHFLKLKI